MCSCGALGRHLERATFLAGKLYVALGSAERSDLRGRGFRCTNKVGRFIRCLGHKGRPLCPRIVCYRKGHSKICIRITVRRGSSFGSSAFDFIGGVVAPRNKARLTNFQGTLAGAFGSCTQRTGVLGSDSTTLAKSSVHRKLATVVDVGVRRPRFRKRAGRGLKGDRTHNTMSSIIARRLACFLRRGPSITGGVYRGSLLTRHTERTTHGTHSLAEEGATLRNATLPKGLTSYSSGGPGGYRVFVIRKSSTNNSTGATEDHTARTVLPLHKGVLGIRGTELSHVCSGTRVGTVVATFNAKVRRSFSVSGLHCGGVVVVASTSISNTRVTALVLAFLCHFVPRLVGRKRICLTAPPLCGVRGGGGI